MQEYENFKRILQNDILEWNRLLQENQETINNIFIKNYENVPHIATKIVDLKINYEQEIINELSNILRFLSSKETTHNLRRYSTTLIFSFLKKINYKFKVSNSDIYLSIDYYFFNIFSNNYNNSLKVIETLYEIKDFLITPFSCKEETKLFKNILKSIEHKIAVTTPFSKNDINNQVELKNSNKRLWSYCSIL